MEHTKKQVIYYVELVQQFGFGILFLLFPLLLSTFTTDVFVLPKQILLAIVVLASLILTGIIMLVEKKVKFRQTSFDLPIFLFVIVLVFSSLFAVNKYDSLIALIPVVLLGLGYFLITNTVRSQKTAFFFISALLVSATIVSILAVASYLKIYLLPFISTHSQAFSPLGTMFNQVVYLAGITPVAFYFAYPIVKGKTDSKTITFSVMSVLLALGLGMSLYELFTIQKPILLPFLSGFQIAFAEISQDTTRIAQAFFFGSGFGTFLADFTRFKQASFNTYQNLWFQLFTQSSSFILELLATTGILGVLSFFFIIGKASVKMSKSVKNPLFFSLAVILILSFLIPFSFTTLSLLFFILALFSSIEGLKHPEKSFDLEFFLVALKHNIFSTDQKPSHHESLVMPIVFFVVILGITGTLGYYATRYVMGDVLFTQSLIAASKNNGSETYQKQVAAITAFPYRDSFYRIFSQTNMSLASSLLTLSNSKGASQDQQTQTTALNLIQQAITSARTATVVSPQTTLNWQNLASTYRALVGFGQNADQFSIASINQAILLDSTNPQEYLTLGGLYYQLGQYDNAIRQFQTTINLKPDYPNAYYNLGHAYEQKGDLQNALSQYQIVKQLVANDANNESKIKQEIDALNQKIGTQSQQTAQKQVKPVQSAATQEPLTVNQPTTQLPQQQQQIPLPTVNPSPTPVK